MVLRPVYTDAELDNIEKEVAPLAQDLPTKIEDEIIPQKIIYVDKPGGELVISGQALKFRYGQKDF